MPEGPEVKNFSKLFPNGKVKITLLRGQYATSPKELCRQFRERIEPFEVHRVYNHGKILIIAGRINLVCQPMLEGYFSLVEDKFSEIKFSFEKKDVYFCDKISLARWFVMSETELQRFLDLLGPDISNPRTGDCEKFCSLLRGRRSAIYKLLLKQEIASGCGNYIRAEAIARCDFDPFITAAEITQRQCRELYEKLIEVAEQAESEKLIFLAYGVGTPIKDGSRSFYIKKK